MISLRSAQVQQFALGLLLLLTLATGAAVLTPGLDGAFVIDDFGSLEDLEHIADDPGLESALRFVLNGVSSPLGRPLSLATFAAQYRSWPNNPEDFLYINVMLHLLNGCLLFWCLLRLLGFLPGRNGPVPGFLALAATWLWLFAAPQVAAVLYVVQRMAELSGTCVLLGLLLYLIGRSREIAGTRGGLAFMAAGVAAGTLLGFLAKETAALFPLLVLCLEYTLLQDLPRSRFWRAFSAVFLWLPGAVVTAQLLSYIPGYSPDSFLRPFSLVERLMTEARVLFMYLQKFLLPPLYGMRLYYDDYPISRGLFTPWTTVLSLAGWAALVLLALKLRRRAAPFSFAVLWYLIAHLLESTFIGLEIAFDHRNYVALVGPAFALCWYGYRLLGLPSLQRVRPVLIAGATLYAGFLAFAFWQAATFWGQPWELANFWAQQQPYSRRAQLTVTKFYWRLHLPQKAIENHERALERWPGDVSFFLAILETGCAYPGLPKPDLKRIPAIVEKFDSTIPATVGMLDVLVNAHETGLCRKYSPTELWSVVEMVFETPKLAPQEQNRLLLLHRIAVQANDRPLARRLLDQAILLGPAPLLLQRGVLMSIDAGDLACARSYLERYKATQGPTNLRALSYQADMERLDDVVTQEAAARPPQPADEPSCSKPNPAGT